MATTILNFHFDYLKPSLRVDMDTAMYVIINLAKWTRPILSSEGQIRLIIGSGDSWKSLFRLITIALWLPFQPSPCQSDPSSSIPIASPKKGRRTAGRTGWTGRFLGVGSLVGSLGGTLSALPSVAALWSRSGVGQHHHGSLSRRQKFALFRALLWDLRQ